MASMLSFPYGSPSPSPYWGPQTSAVNFCEEDYVITQYVGEFINCLTSIVYIGYGVYGINRHEQGNPSIFAVAKLPYWGLVGIGLFSGLYHCTLKYHTQMADEMSMHLAMGCVLFRLFTFQQPLAIQRRNAALITVGLTSFIIYHCVTDEFVLHVILFIALSLTVTWKTRDTIRRGMEPLSHKKKLTSLITLAAFTAIFAYILWNIDVNLCSTLTSWKRSMGLPYGIILELHGWWHILTAVACYLYVAVIEYVTCDRESDDRAKGFAWPARAVLLQLDSRRADGGQVEGSSDAAARRPANGTRKRKV